MQGKTFFAAMAVLTATTALLLPTVAVAQSIAPGAPWTPATPLAAAEAFPAVEPNIDGRPSVLLETDFYVYGATGLPTEPELNLTLANNGFPQAATLYLYWQNRVSGDRMYYNVNTGLTAQERDLFGTTDRPIRVFVPSLTDFQLFGPQGALGPLPGNVPRNTGQYQFVLEVRGADGDSVVSRGNAMYSFVDQVIQKAGNINASETWTSNNAYIMPSPVNVFGPAVLTIEPGTVVLGVAAENPGTLIIRPGAQIIADGNAMQPIIMTSDQPVGERQPGDWGGLVVSGNAPTNQQNPEGEGDSGVFGGDDPNDNSGILRYVRVEFAGTRFSTQNELNGIAFQGVGNQTVIEHVQVHFNQDDGIEFFGGTADAKWLLLTGVQDDSLDWTFGWQGKVQYLVVVQQGQEADKGIEADNFEDDFGAEPVAFAQISHCTFVKKPEVPNIDPAFQFRRGTDVTLKNCIIQGYNDPEDGVVLVDPDEPPRNVTVDNNFFFGNAGPNPPANLGTNFFTNPNLADPFALVPDVAPLPGPARNGAMPIADPFFDNVNFIGGVNPQNPWIYEGWATFSDN